MDSTVPVLSVVIPVLNQADKLRVCLDSLQKNLNDISYEVIIIDNGSTDGAREMVKNEYPWVCLVENEVNRFYAASNNQGFNMSRGRYILLLNSDTELIGNVAQRMIEYMDKPENENVAGCNCNIYFPDGSLQLEADYYLPSAKVLFYRFLSARRGIRDKFPGLYAKVLKKIYCPANTTDIVTCEALIGAAVLMRGSVIRELKGFDEKYVHWFTDDELCYRIRQKGYKLVSLPYEKIMHHHGASNRELPTASQVFTKDFFTYVKDKLGWHYFLIMYPLYKLYNR